MKWLCRSSVSLRRARIISRNSVGFSKLGLRPRFEKPTSFREIILAR